jgi:hypothetical protein
MIGLLNRFHAAAGLAIQNSGGAVDKYVGDGLTATFGLPQPLAAPQRNALEAAQDLLLRIERLNGELAAEGIEPLRVGIGIHSGEVLAGYVGSRPAPRVFGDWRFRRHREPAGGDDKGLRSCGALHPRGGGGGRVPRRPRRTRHAGGGHAAGLGMDAPGTCHAGGRGMRGAAEPRIGAYLALLWFAGSRRRELRRPLLRIQLDRQIQSAGIAALPIIVILALLTGAAVSIQLAAPDRRR